MFTTVVNLRFETYDVYIGRAGRGQSGFYGNPFGRDHAPTAAERLQLYMEWMAGLREANGRIRPSTKDILMLRWPVIHLKECVER